MPLYLPFSSPRLTSTIHFPAMTNEGLNEKRTRYIYHWDPHYHTWSNFDVQQMQGVLQCTLRSSPTGQLIDENEVRRRFQAFGDLKSVRPVGERIDSLYVEFYDMRVCLTFVPPVKVPIGL